MLLFGRNSAVAEWVCNPIEGRIVLPPTLLSPKWQQPRILILVERRERGDGGMADAAVLKTAGVTPRAGSTPAPRTQPKSA